MGVGGGRFRAGAAANMLHISMKACLKQHQMELEGPTLPLQRRISAGRCPCDQGLEFWGPGVFVMSFGEVVSLSEVSCSGS